MYYTLICNFFHSLAPMLLLILVHASGNAEGRKKRDAIRNTWLSEVDQLSQKIGQAIKYR